MKSNSTAQNGLDTVTLNHEQELKGKMRILGIMFISLGIMIFDDYTSVLRTWHGVAG